jgi:hypothetical protein
MSHAFIASAVICLIAILCSVIREGRKVRAPAPSITPLQSPEAIGKRQAR